LQASRVKRLVAVILFILLALPFTASGQTDDTAKITDIQVKGNSKVEAETIRSRMSLQVGDVFSPSAVRNDVTALFKMGFFDDVQVEAEGFQGGLRLIFTVVERPIVRSFAFEGNDNIEAAKLREKLTLTPYSVFNPSLVAQNVEILKLYYQGEGYFNVRITPVVVKLNDKEDKVIFLVEEGDKVRIDDIEFAGNENMSSRKLRKAMTTKEYNMLWSWLLDTGAYKLYEFDNDLERIKALYFNNGYIQMSVGEPDVVLDEKDNELDITIPIHEGVQFAYGKLDVSGNSVFASEELLDNVKAKTGDIMNREQLRQDVIKLTGLYGTKGYAFANVSPIINPDVDTRTVDVTFQVEESDLIHVNRIEISGNASTKDKVIRREVPFFEGDIYDTSGLKKGSDRLKNLDFFEDMTITPERVPDTNEVNLRVNVKEKSTGSFSIGGGYSTVDRLMAIGEIKQRNLFGNGQELNFRGQWGSRRHNFTLGFVEPWLFDRPISLGVEAFNENKEETTIGYSTKSVGGSLTLGRRFWDYWSISGTYSYANVKFYDVGASAIAAYGQEEFDDKTISKIGMSVARDSRDNYMFPAGGSKSSIFGEVASSYLGSSDSYYRVVGDSVYYFPFYWDTVFSLHGRAGIIYGFNGDTPPVSELFYLGGINTIRGYDWGEVGPKAADGQILGGNKHLLFNAEYTFPLLTAIKLYGVTFFDAGDSYGYSHKFDLGSLRYSAGGGFRWMSPMGLVRLEYGKVLDNKDPNQTGKWEFSIGTMF